MDFSSQQPCASNALQKNTQNSRRSLKGLNWDTYKEEIRRTYRDNTLQVTMRLMEEKYHFKASERSWKMKLKSWGYEKYLSSADKKIIVAKADKRTREEGKNTAFFHVGSEIQPDKIECFKKRKTTNFVEAVSPSAETPANVTYHTPRSEGRSPEFATPGKVLLAPRRESFSDTSASNFAGSEIAPAELPLPSNDRYVSQRDGHIRNLSTYFSKDIITPKTRPDALNSNDLYKTIILHDMALPKTSKHREGTQMNGAYESFHNHAMSGTSTAEKTRAVWSDLSDQVRMDKSQEFQAYQSPQEVAEKKIAESESLLRRLLREEERQFLNSHKRYEEVENLSRRAIAGFKDLGLIGDWLECQCFLGDSLQLQDLDDGATPVLLSAIARSLISNAHYAHNQLRCAMFSLQASHGKPKHRGRFNQAISTIFQMEKILLNPKPFRSVYVSDPELLFQGLMLAKTYSMMGELEFAEIIFSALMPEVNRIRDGIDKFFGYLWYCLHHQRLRHLQQAARNLTLAYQTLSQSDKIWFNGEKMKSPWKNRSAKAALRSALSLPENNPISDALQKGWWDPENEVPREWKIRPCATQLQADEEDSSSEFEGISHKYRVSISGPEKV